jgi:hypothetical protein
VIGDNECPRTFARLLSMRATATHESFGARNRLSGLANTTNSVLRRPSRRRVTDPIDISHRTSYFEVRGAQTLPLD